MVSSVRSALVAAMAVASAYAQTHTVCSPLNETCPADTALGTFTEFNFTSVGINPNVWVSTSTPIQFSDNEGAKFSVAASGDGPNMNTAYNIFWGSISVVMKASPGAGIVSSIVLLSDDLDEIDIEILGSNRTVVESNFFGKGNTTTYNRAIYHPVNFAPQDDYHNYTVTMTSQWITWSVDGQLLRNLTYDNDITVFGKNFPQTPMKLYVGSWAGGDPKNAEGTIAWAQGPTDFSKGPFNMYVKSITIQDGTTNATSYTYGDTTGDWTSIKVEKGVSPIVSQIQKPLGVTSSWNSLSSGVKIGIIAGSASGALILLSLITFCCIKTARKGAREAALAEAEWAAQQKEAEMWRQKYREEHSDRLSTVHSNKSFGGGQFR